ncbi:MAG TPA: alpha/beta fold hydrolase [Flavisolibacter sp.]|nr:alpha/beta fold hydrolase [Flavisolibacter sp.]
MKNKLALLLLALLSLAVSSTAQKTTRPVYVIVHGAWGGSWSFKKIDSLLTQKGATVYRPSLTAQGERVHLANEQVGLKTHITDVVNTILYEDLRDVILVGHSYGGMVITGVADSVPGRIRKLIYLDAFLPEHGETVFDIFGNARNDFKSMVKGGFIVPPWVVPSTPPPTDVPHPLKTFTDTIQLTNKQRSRISSTYILTVDKGVDRSKDDFYSQAERARKKGWTVLQLTSDHNPQWSAPLALAAMLERVRKQQK